VLTCRSSGAEDGARPVTDGTLDERARQGRKFAAVAAEYDRGRPGYPAALLDVASTVLHLPAGATVVDVGAGTGKLTARLAERFRVIAVEPLPAMRGVLSAQVPGVTVRAGSAEELPVPDGTAAAVFVAEAFHWFDGPAALAEAARVLRPAGGIVLLWNVPAGGWEPPLPERARRLVRDAIARGGEPGGPLVARGEWRAAFDDSPFAPPRHERITHELVLDRAGLVASVLSISSVAGLPAADREALRDRLTALLPDRRHRRALHTELYWARRHDVSWCDRCGGPLGEGQHAGCASARELEPPRFCPRCRRRMKVQVLPDGWVATCTAHGETRAARA
jgi:SAM-dependent methyltransferase